MARDARQTLSGMVSAWLPRPPRRGAPPDFEAPTEPPKGLHILRLAIYEDKAYAKPGLQTQNQPLIAQPERPICQNGRACRQRGPEEGGETFIIRPLQAAYRP